MSDEELVKLENDPIDPKEYSGDLIQLITFIREDQQFALDLIENAERERNGKFDRDELVREALDILINTRIKAVNMRQFQQGRNFLKTGE